VFAPCEIGVDLEERGEMNFTQFSPMEIGMRLLILVIFQFRQVPRFWISRKDSLRFWTAKCKFGLVSEACFSNQAWPIWFLKLVSEDHSRCNKSFRWKIRQLVSCKCTFYNFERVISIVWSRIHLISINLSLVCGDCIKPWCAKNIAKRTLIFYAQVFDREKKEVGLPFHLSFLFPVMIDQLLLGLE